MFPCLWRVQRARRHHLVQNAHLIEGKESLECFAAPHSHTFDVRSGIGCPSPTVSSALALYSGSLANGAQIPCVSSKSVFWLTWMRALGGAGDSSPFSSVRDITVAHRKLTHSLLGWSTVISSYPEVTVA
jgi:hypothetical protein